MSPSPPRKAAHRYRRGATTFAALVMWTGALATAVGGYACWQGLQTLSWPRIPADVVAREVSTGTTVAPTQPGSGAPPASTRETAGVNLAYRYVIDAAVYEGTALEPWDLGVPGRAAVDTVQKFVIPGSKVDIAYDPSNPRVAYLLPGPSGTAVSLTIFGVVLLVTGLAMGKLTRRA